MAYIESEPFYEDFASADTVAASKMLGMFKVIRGVETCKILNGLLSDTFLIVTLRIGERPYRVLRVTPQPEGKIRVSMVGSSSVVLPWFTKFDFHLAGTIQEFDSCYRLGEPARNTGPIS